MVSEVNKELTKMNCDKSPGPDQVHPKVLKMCADSLAVPLTKLFTKSLETGKVPTSWKEAKVTPIFKKGNKKQGCNYRPVSLTSVVCKLLERLIRTRIMNHLDVSDLRRNQYGFRAKRSTTLQLLRVLDQWTEMIDRGECFDVLYMDFSKIFDTIPHQHLLRYKRNASELGGRLFEYQTTTGIGKWQPISMVRSAKWDPAG